MSGGHLRRCTITAALIGGIVLASGPVSASAKVSRDFFGVSPMEVPSGEEFARIGAGGIGEARIAFLQSVVEPQPGLRDWRVYDQIFGNAARAGVRVGPTIFGTPQWMNAKPATMPIQSPAQEASWSSFVLDGARRYGPGGSFWAEHPELPNLPAMDWEIWNEPNISEYVAEPANARRYARLIVIADQALAAAHPGNRVVLAGLYRQPRRGFGIRMTRYLESLYRLKRLKGHFDSVAVHPYSSQPRQVLKVLGRVREIMRAHGDARTPLLITEMGWTTGGQGWARSAYRTTPAGQAIRLKAVFRLLIKNRRTLHLRRVDWFSWRDSPGLSSFWTHHMGLFTVNGQPKPAWAALIRLTGGSGSGPITNLGIEPLPPPSPSSG
jgi:hypothetical protein